jgi:hypothetical protein
MNKKHVVFAVMLIVMVVLLTISCISNNNIMQENELLAAQLIDTQKELAVAQDELFVAEESFRIETDRHSTTQRDLEEANEYIDILIDEKYIVDYEVTNAEIEIIAKAVWGEARGCNQLEQSAVIWCILNRVDAGYGTIVEVVTAPNQFHGYDSSFPVADEIKALTEDVIARWKLEKAYGGNFGRTLPSEYLYFSADATGIGNVFRTKWAGDCEVWDWNCWNPYLTIQD